MKKSGIINPELIKSLTELGHFDSFVICDMGFPIPKHAQRIDLSLLPGYPKLIPVLKACLGEVVVQEMVMLDGVETANEELYKEVTELVHNQEMRYVNLTEFRKMADDAKFFVRTGEDAPCSNIYLVSASGVKERVEKYNIDVGM